MYTDATCYESEMRYPTDPKLLWEEPIPNKYPNKYPNKFDSTQRKRQETN